MADITWTLPDGQQIVGSLTQTVVNASDVTGVEQVSEGSTGVRTATSSLSATPLGSLTLSLALRPSGSTAPAPVDPTVPTDTITIANISYALSGVNPGSTGGTGGDSTYPGYRGVDQLIYYSNPTVTVTITNQWGVEVVVDATTNLVESVNDRQANADTVGTTIASGKYVLSGHGAARDWLLANAVVGAEVSFTGVVSPDPTPVDPGETSTSSAYPTKAISVYQMGGNSITNLTSNCNVIRLAFAQGSPPSMVSWGGLGSGDTVSTMAARRAAGTRFLISVGGAGGAVNTSARSTFLSGVASMISAYDGNIDGLDWDIEASTMSQSDVVYISTQLKALYGSDFAITFAPNGSNVSQYLPTAVACNAAGALDEYGQQFYDAPVSLSAAMGRIAEAIGAGIPQSKLSVGMMIGSDANHWTLATCQSYMASIRSSYPSITKAYLWWNGESQVNAWTAAMKAVIG